MKYNGWYNYETWCCNLWMENGENSYNYFIELAERCLDGSERDDAIADFSLLLKEYFEIDLQEFHHNGQPNLFTDLLNHAVGMIDFFEIADHWIEKAEE